MAHFNRELRISMAAVSMLLAAALDSYLVMAASFVFCLLVLLYDLYQIFAEGFRARFFLVSSLTCGIWLSVGFLVSFFQADYGKLIDFKSLFIDSSIIIDSWNYSLASSYLMFFIAVASMVSRLRAMRQAECNFQSIVVKKLIFYGRFYAVIVLLLLSVFGIIISGLNLIVVRGLGENFQNDQGVLPWWYPLTMTLISLFPVLIATCIKQDFRLVSPRGLLVLVGTIIPLYFAALQGRGSMLSFFVSIPLNWLLLFKPFFKLTPKIFTFVILLVLVLWLLLPAFSTVFDFINYARKFRGGSINPSQLLELFTDFLSNASKLTEVSAKSAENLIVRPLVLWPLAASISMAIKGLNSDYLYLQDIVNSLLNSLPRFIYPFKGELLLQENLLYTYFPFSSVDTADSPYLFSFASFGLLGIIVYPLLIGLLYWTFLNIATNSIRMLTGISAFFSSALAFVVVSDFAIKSYGELATSGLIRQFLLPAAVIFVIRLICAPFRTLARA